MKDSSMPWWYAQEEREMWDEQQAMHDNIKSGINDLVPSVCDIDDHRSGEGLGLTTNATQSLGEGAVGETQAPLRPRGPLVTSSNS